MSIGREKIKQALFKEEKKNIERRKQGNSKNNNLTDSIVFSSCSLNILCICFQCHLILLKGKEEPNKSFNL